MNCIVCSGRLIQLGTLGRLTHYRCRSCGMDHTHEFENVTEPEDSPGIIAWDDKLTRGAPPTQPDEGTMMDDYRASCEGI